MDQQNYSLAEELNSMKYRELQKLAKEHGVKANLSKAAIIPAILAKIAPEEIPDDLKCGICLDLYLDPLELIPCNHILGLLKNRRPAIRIKPHSTYPNLT